VPFDPHDRDYLMQHFLEHGHEFGAATADEYEQMADTFMNGPCLPPMLQCSRANGARCMYDPRTGEYCVVASWGHIRTYFKPVRCADLEENDDSECHTEASNVAYFWARC
jgi:pyocin large subunit-like protein